MSKSDQGTRQHLQVLTRSDNTEDVAGRAIGDPENVVLELSPLMAQDLDHLLSWCETAPDLGKHRRSAFLLRQALLDAPRVTELDELLWPPRHLGDVGELDDGTLIPI
jgi:hypothetical protein